MVIRTRVSAPRLLTTSQAASILNVHQNTLRRWSESGILTPYRIGPRADRRFAEEDIAELAVRIHRNNGDARGT